MNLNKRIIDNVAKPFSIESPYSGTVQFDDEVLEYCQLLRSTNNTQIDVRMSKVIIIGDMGVGKTSVVQKFTKNIFNNDYRATIGVDFEVIRFKILSLPFNVQVWDTAGQERFRCISSAYYRGAQAVILTCSLDNNISLSNTKRWLDDVLNVLIEDGPRPLIFLLGTKKDLLNTKEMEITEKETIEFAKKINSEYWSVSSLTGENVDEFFSRMTSLLFNASINRELDERYLKTIRRSIGHNHSNFKSPETVIDYQPYINLDKVEKKLFEQMDKKCC